MIDTLMRFANEAAALAENQRLGGDATDTNFRIAWKIGERDVIPTAIVIVPAVFDDDQNIKKPAELAAGFHLLITGDGLWDHPATLAEISREGGLVKRSKEKIIGALSNRFAG